MDRRTPTRVAARALRTSGLHRARHTGRALPSTARSALPRPLRGRLAIGAPTGPAALRNQARMHRRAPHLGAEPALPSPRPHHHDRRWHDRRRSLEAHARRLLPAGQSAERNLPRQVLRRAPAAWAGSAEQAVTQAVGGSRPRPPARSRQLTALPRPLRLPGRH